MGTQLSTGPGGAASTAADVVPAPDKQQKSPQQQQRVYATESPHTSSLSSSSHMDTDHEEPLKHHQQQQHQPAAGRSKLLATAASLFRKPWSQASQHWVLSGIPAHTEEQQAAVHAAYDEVMAGGKLRFEDLYAMGHMLGSGHYARVHVARSLQDGAAYAAKVLPKALKKSKAQQQLQTVVKEVAVMRLLAGHPSAVKLHQVVHDKQNYYLVMEHCSGGELFDYAYKLDHLPEAEAAAYMGQLASFLAYAHAKHIVHRDIKPENMLLAPAGSSSAAADGSADATDASTQVTPWRLKVIDYGCSGFCLPGQQLHEAVGTVCYVAPEVLWHHYDASSDVWSAGVVLYMLLCGYLPFDGRNNEETLMLVRAGDYDMEPEDWAHVSQAGQELVRQLLTYKPEARPTAAQLLQHSWIQQRAAASAAADPAANGSDAESAAAAADGAAVLPGSAGAPPAADA